MITTIAQSYGTRGLCGTGTHRALAASERLRFWFWFGFCPNCVFNTCYAFSFQNQIPVSPDYFGRRHWSLLSVRSVRCQRRTKGVLDEFKQQGIDLSVRNEPIVRDWSWNCIRQTINWPWHTMTGKDIPHCRGLTLVVTDESARKTGIRNHSASGQRTAATFPRRRASAVKGLLTGSSRQFRKRDRPP